MGIAKINTTGLVPTAASPVERLHRGLSASLTMLCNTAKNDWAFLVDSVTFAYNISVNESTGYSPFYLTTGRIPHLPISVITELQLASVRHKNHKFVEEMTSALNEAYQFVRKQQLRTLERNQKVQLGLSSAATKEQVWKELDKRKIPGFHKGQLVSLWEPEIVDIDIQHKMPLEVLELPTDKLIKVNQIGIVDQSC